MDVRARWRVEVGVRLDEFCLQDARLMWRDGRDTGLRVDRSANIIDAESGTTVATVQVEHALYSLEGVRIGSLDVCSPVVKD